MRSLISVVSFVLWLAIPTFSQSLVAKPSFEVATIKLNTALQGGSRQGDQPGGRFSATRVTLRSLIGFAKYPGGGSVLGGPTWMDSDLWDVEAKAAEGSIQPRSRLLDLNAPAGAIQLMVQSLLEDRFQLKIHSETRELPVYELTVAKGGPKAKLAEDQSPPMMPEPGAPPLPAGTVPRGLMRMGRGDFEDSAISIDSLASALAALYLGRPVIDKTGLKGFYDIKLQWTPDPASNDGPFQPGAPIAGPDTAADPSGLSIFTAIQEQLGLKLESTKGPVKVLVIDSVQKPSQN
jgi:uncharacterized protein (TIGR03435 family)